MKLSNVINILNELESEENDDIEVYVRFDSYMSPVMNVDYHPETEDEYSAIIIS